MAIKANFLVGVNDPTLLQPDPDNLSNKITGFVVIIIYEAGIVWQRRF
jgi:hypothetical protein